MNILFCTVGRRGYLVNYFKKHLNSGKDLAIGTSDRHSKDLEFTPGFFYCDKTYLVPSIMDEFNYIQSLLDICKKENIDMLLSFYDLDYFVISKYINEFKSIGVIPIISSFEVNSIAFDKFKTYQFLKNNGFNTPKTWLSKDYTKLRKIDFPVIVKPRFGFGSKYIQLANNHDEIEFFLRYYKDNELIIQEFLEGEEYSFDILSDLNSRTIVAVTKRKIKMRAGETDQGYAIHNDRLTNLAYRLSQQLKHVGPLDVDFFMVNDEPFILEFNPRFGGGYPITHLAGVDFTKLIIDMVKGNLDDNYSIYQRYKSGNVMIKDIKILKLRLPDE